MKKPSNIVVIGGGIAGTAAARALSRLGHHVTIFEQNDRLGGRIRSVAYNGYNFEVGAGFVTSFYTHIFELMKEVQLDGHLVRRRNTLAIVREGAPHPVTSSSVLLGRGLLPWRAKTQLVPIVLKTFRAWSSLNRYRLEEAAKYDVRNLDSALQGDQARELLDYLLQPMLSGYFYWSADEISESMLLWLIRTALAGGQTYAVGEGLQRLPESAARDSEVLLSHSVQSIRRTRLGYDIGAHSPESSKTLRADGIVCATTASAVPKILEKLTPAQQRFFSDITYSSTAVLAQIFNSRISPKNWSIGYPRKEGSILDAATIVSDTNDQGEPVSLVKLFASGARGQEICHWDDEKVKTSLTSGASLVRSTLENPSNPSFECVQRWPEALPIFQVGHFRKLRDFASGEVEGSEPLVFAGDYIGGPFMEGAFSSGVKAAERLSKRLG